MRVCDAACVRIRIFKNNNVLLKDALQLPHKIIQGYESDKYCLIVVTKAKTVIILPIKTPCFSLGEYVSVFLAINKLLR